jgi:hypothetical protein
MPGGALAKDAEEDEHDEADDHSGDAEGGTGIDGEGDHGDEPSWVNGSYLTCAWDGAEAASEVAVLCQLDDRDGNPVPSAAASGIVLDWQVQRSSGETEAVAQESTGSATAIEQRFLLPAAIVADLTIAVILSGDGSGTAGPAGAPLAVLSAKLETELPGLAPGEAVRDCLERGDPADQCLAQTTPPPATKRFFVTSQSFTGDLGGIAGADAKCAAAATNASLGGTWIAVISTSSSMIIDRVTRGVPVVDLDGAPIASDAQVLLGGGPQTSLGVDETGTAVSAAAVWTGSLTGGQASDQDCGGWSSALGAGTTGAFGGGAAFGEWLVSTLGDDCGVPARLYCLEL